MTPFNIYASNIFFLFSFQQKHTSLIINKRQLLYFFFLTRKNYTPHYEINFRRRQHTYKRHLAHFREIKLFVSFVVQFLPHIFFVEIRKRKIPWVLVFVTKIICVHLIGQSASISLFIVVVVFFFNYV